MMQRKIAVLFVAVGLIGALFLDGCAGRSQVVTTQVRESGQEPVKIEKNKKTLTVSENMEQVLAREFAQTHKHMANHADVLANHILQADKNTAALAEELVQQISRGNEKTMRQLDEVQVSQKDSLRTAQQTLEKLELISKIQGSGQITLFFKRGSAALDRFQYQRLVNFLDYLSRESRGREVILVSIGSASATGRDKINRKLSVKRSEAPLSLIKQYLVNTQYKLYEVAGIGNQQAPKNAGGQVNKSHQSVRIIAVYESSHLPAIPKG